MEFFVKQGSIVRRIWGKSDTVLFIFAGAAAEFALNKAVDWLYFTGRLPADPLRRLFSTAMYAHHIVFAENAKAEKVIDNIAGIHSEVERKRGSKIPDWAYRDVLFMLIHYSQASFELLERKLTDAEKEELFDVFKRVGIRMGLKDIPDDYKAWKIAHNEHLKNDIRSSRYTSDLFKQYRKHLGWIRYRLLLEAQRLVVPHQVRSLLNFGRIPWLKPVIPVYKLSRKLRLDGFLKSLILPKTYKEEIRQLDTEGNR